MAPHPRLFKIQHGGVCANFLRCFLEGWSGSDSRGRSEFWGSVRPDIHQKTSKQTVWKWEEMLHALFTATGSLNFSLWGIVWHPRWIIKLWPFILIKGDVGRGEISSRERPTRRQAVRNSTEIKRLVLQRLDGSTTAWRKTFTCAAWGIEFAEGFVRETLTWFTFKY